MGAGLGDGFVERRPIRSDRQTGNEYGPAIRLGHDLRAGRTEHGEEVAQSFSVDDGGAGSIPADRGGSPPTGGIE